MSTIHRGSMKISVNKAHFPVTVLGPGHRIGIWLQGCSIGCKGCVSQDTWDKNPGREMTVAQLLDWCEQSTNGHFSGVTISGGEPFDQPAALAALLDGLHSWRSKIPADFDILCYSGYPLAKLQNSHQAILDKLDAIIPEPYVDKLPLAQIWRGSSNQPLVPLSPLGKERFGQYIDAVADSTGKRIQTMVDGQQVWFVGIPGRGDMEALEASCAARGVALTSVSWRQ